MLRNVLLEEELSTPSIYEISINICAREKAIKFQCACVFIFTDIAQNIAAILF